MGAVTDMTFLKTFTGGNPEKIKKYVGMFLQHCPGQLENMAGQLNGQDYDSLRATAHALKPQITYMGIRNGEALVKSIESMAGSRTDVEKLPAVLDEFKTLCHQAMEELKKEIA